MSILDVARGYVAAGLSVIPILADGSKKAAFAWKAFQTKAAAAPQIEQWFTESELGIAILGGNVSGGLEILDFDSAAAYRAWLGLMSEVNPGLLPRMPHVQTPSGGTHLFYRVDAPAGNLKLAKAANGETAIETRGEGGYVLAPGCPAACHETGNTYDLDAAGPGLDAIPHLSAEERDLMHTAARSLNEYAQQGMGWDSGPAAGMARPGDDFNAKATWEEILEPHGWVVTGRKGETALWRRPGKEGRVWSATTGHCKANGRDLLYVFSGSAAPFVSEKTYSRFAAFTVLNHGGNFTESARALASKGYGEQKKPHETNRSAPYETPPTSAKDDAKPLRGWVDGEGIIYRGSDVVERELEWLWPDRIPADKLTTFAGVGGLGKTFVLCDMAARVTAGLVWPDLPGECAKQGQVLFISGEDDPDDTIVPRMRKMGADLSRVVFLKTAVQDRFTIQDLDTLSEAMKQAKVGQGRLPVRLIAIDPPTAFLGGADDHKNSELRGLLSPLKSWARAWGCAIVFITHFNKASGQKIEAMMRVIGGVAWVNAVRAAHVFARDQDDAKKRLFVPMKNNNGPEPNGLAYRLSFEPKQMAVVEWLGEVETSADDAINRKEQERTPTEAADLIRELFDGKKELASSIIWAAAKEARIGANAIKAAQKDLGIRAVKRYVSGQHLWVWHWPEEGGDDITEGDNCPFRT